MSSTNSTVSYTVNDIMTPRPKASWHDVSLEQRLQYFYTDLFVPHPDMLHVIEVIKKAARHCVLAKKGAAIYVEIESGGGKTTLTRFFKAYKPDVITDELTRCRVVAFTVPKIVNPSQMETALLTALGDPKPWMRELKKRNSGSESGSKPTSRCFSLIQTIRPEIIFIDNIHDIPEKRRSCGIKAVGGWIRDLAEDCFSLVVLLGTKDAKPVIASNPQLKRRSSNRQTIGYFNVHEPEGLARLKRFLSELEKRMPLAIDCDLTSSKIVRRFAWATGGIQYFIFKIVGFAILNATDSGRERIEIGDLAVGFSDTFGCDGEGMNPFLGQSSRILNNEGEPLYEFFVSPVEVTTAK
jgi:hypothetical protein